MPIITQDQLRRIAPHGKPNIIAAIAGQADRVFPKYGYSTLARVQVFVGLCVEETGGFTGIEEDLQHYSAARLTQVWPTRFHTAAAAAPYANNAAGLAEVVYGGRMGNAHPGDGYKYRGRGLIQITGHDNYATLAKQTGIDLVNKPDLALSDEGMLECSAALFVRYPGILKACDAGDVTRVWNMVGGGAMNVPAHQQALSRTKAVITLLGKAGATEAPKDGGEAVVHDTRWLQAALNRLGTTPPLDIDGLAGPATVRAIKFAQRAAGLDQDGIVGPLTTAAIEAALAKRTAA